MNQVIAQKRFTLVMLIALLMNLVLPVFTVYELSRFLPFVEPSTTQQQDTFSLTELKNQQSESILLCTVEGFKWVTVAELAVNPRSESHSYYECALCYLTAHDAKLILPLPAAHGANGFFVVVDREVSTTRSVRAEIYARGFPARAPPALPNSPHVIG